MSQRRHSGSRLRKKQNQNRNKKKINWDKIKWGSLTNWLKRYRTEIEKVTGKDPFIVDKKTGKIKEINDNVLEKLDDPETLKKITPQWKRIRKKIRFKLNVLGR